MMKHANGKPVARRAAPKRAPDPLRAPPAAPAPVLQNAAQMEAAAAAATMAEGQARAREAMATQLVGSLGALVSGIAGNDLEIALCALATVTGQVMAATENPPGALAYVVRLANQTVQQIMAQQTALAASQRAA